MEPEVVELLVVLVLVTAEELVLDDAAVVEVLVVLVAETGVTDVRTRSANGG